jgi:hypothetical protein
MSLSESPKGSHLLRSVAMVCHEANRAYCLSIGDDSQLSWKDAPDWQKESAIAGVKAIKDNPETTPEESHKGWLALKESEGWVYGELKDAEIKTHPCMLPYDQLPEPQKVKDHLFGAICRVLLF